MGRNGEVQLLNRIRFAGHRQANEKGRPAGRPFLMQSVSALLRIAAALIGTLFAAGLAVLAILLLLLAALLFIAVRLRFLLILLVGGVSHFTISFCRQKHIDAAFDKPFGRDRCSVRRRPFAGLCPFCDERGERRAPVRVMIGPLNH